MKTIGKFYLFCFILINATMLLGQVSTQQKVGSIDESGYWTLGLNAGFSYQSSDVRAITGGYGFGATLAKNLYQRTGGPIAFDLRGRFLYAQNYGLDAERSYQIDKNTVLNGSRSLDYLNYPADLNEPRGFVYQNHQTSIGELSLEGVLTLNRLREKTGVIASLYGGIGIDWYRAKIDQADANGNPYYEDYATLDENQRTSRIRQELKNNILDGDYETVADGFDNDGGKIGFMPSLGIELGYQFTPRFSMHLGHRITFAGTDILDGQQWSDDNKDIYHYTNFALRWKIEERQSKTLAPVIDLISPARSPHTMGASSGIVRANIRNVSSAMDINCRFNSRTQPFDFYDGAFSTDLLLEPGRNELIITASNEVGTDRETLIIFYKDEIVTPPVVDRRLPHVIITNPPQREYRSSSPSFNIQASLQEVTSQNDIDLIFNGRAIRNFTFDSRTGALRANVQLDRGRNTVRITGRNRAGVDEAEAFITYEEQAVPYVKITAPNRERTETELPTTRIEAEIRNIDRKDQIDVWLNGRVLSNFDFIASQQRLVVNIRLEPGNNHVQIKAQNQSGRAEDNAYINFRERVTSPPRVTITRPGNNSTTDTYRVDLRARTENVHNKSEIRVFLNGRSFTNFSFNSHNQEITANLNLEEGNNILLVRVQNNDGNSEDQVNVRYNKATNPPSVNISQPTNNANVSNDRVPLRATTRNVTSSNQIRIYLNGRSFTNFSFNRSRQEITATVNLDNGNNGIRIQVQNNDGTAEDEVNVRYNKATNPPSVNISQPTNNANVSNDRVPLRATTRNVTSSNQIRIYLNGRSFTNFSFNRSRQEITATVNLDNGNNGIRIQVQNNDGTAEDEVNVRYLQPVALPTVDIIEPGNNTTSNQAQINLRADTRNVKSKNDVRIYLNNRRITSFNFNTSRQEVTANLTLEGGNNSIKVEVSNSDGNADDAVNVRYNPAKKPEVTISTPGPAQSTTNQNSQPLEATVRNVDSKQQITITLNGRKWSSFDYNAQTDQVTARLTLTTGINRIVVSAKNSSGQSEASKVVTYKLVKLPKVVITSPKNNGQFSKEPIIVTANLENVSGTNNITFKIDNKSSSNFSFKNGQLKANLTNLTRGQHTISIIGRNDDGQDEASVRFQFVPPLVSKPKITFRNPAKPGSSVSETKQSIVARIENVSNAKQIKLFVNRKRWPTFNFNEGKKELNTVITLGKGTTSIRIEATNEGGSADAETTIVYKPSTKRPPVVTIESVSQPVTNPLNPTVGRSTVIATIKNISGADQVTFKVNNERITNFAFNAKSGKFECTVNLVRGENLIYLEATNKDGKDSKSETVNF